MKKAFLIALALYGVVVLGMYAFQRRFVFPGAFFSNVPCEDMARLGANFDETPDTQGREYRRFRLQRPDAKAWVILTHGNAKNACARAFFIGGLSDIPMNWIVVEYPGYAGGRGEATVEGTLLSGHQAYEEVTRLNSSRLPIFVFGESLGTAVATHLASTEKVNGLVLQTPFTSISQVARTRYWFLPVDSILNLDFPADTWAPQVKAPVLIYHSVDDSVIPFEIGKRQSENFTKGLVEFHEYKTAGHVQFRSTDGKRFWSMLRGFFDRNIK